MVTDRYRRGDEKVLFAKMPIFNSNGLDISGVEALVIGWLMMRKYSSYNRGGKSTSYAEIGRAIGTNTRKVARTVAGLAEKGLIDIEDVRRGEYMITYSGEAPPKEYRAITITLVTTSLFSFKLKGFIVAAMLTSSSYVINMGSVTDIVRSLSMSRDSIKAHLAELKALGYLKETSGGMILNLYDIFQDGVVDNVERMLRAEFENKLLRLENERLKDKK